MPMEILLVEDNEGDARLLRELLLETNKTVRLHVVSDGVEALAFLKYQGKYIDAPRPDLILLDLNLLKMDGRKVLAHVKADPQSNSSLLATISRSCSSTRRGPEAGRSYEAMHRKRALARCPLAQLL
jgi:CheY-like chemotaxis protein